MQYTLNEEDLKSVIAIINTPQINKGDFYATLYYNQLGKTIAHLSLDTFLEHQFVAGVLSHENITNEIQIIFNTPISEETYNKLKTILTGKEVITDVEISKHSNLFMPDLNANRL